jgi:hypothetical protein
LVAGWFFRFGATHRVRTCGVFHTSKALSLVPPRSIFRFILKRNIATELQFLRQKSDPYKLFGFTPHPPRAASLPSKGRLFFLPLSFCHTCLFPHPLFVKHTQTSKSFIIAIDNQKNACYNIITE